MVEMKMMKNKKDENQLLKVMSMIKMTTYDENAVNVNDELWTGLVTLYLVLALQPWQGLIFYITNLIKTK